MMPTQVIPTRWNRIFCYPLSTRLLSTPPGYLFSWSSLIL